MFVTGFTICFLKGWLMTLVTIIAIITIGIGGYLYSSAFAKKDRDLEKEYSCAGGIAEQAISAVKTVKQLNGEEYEAEKYA
jgi:ATP-binding cassette subfamily B (MDR/TAP) protein 1